MCVNCADLSGFDEAARDAFGAKAMAILNGGALSLMLSVGHRTGLFDAMAGQGEMTARELARRTDLNERYVREWLHALVTGEVVHYNAARGVYWLPDEHAAFLTRTAGVNNVSRVAQFVSVLGKVEDEIVDCFSRGGGVPYGFRR